MYIPMWELWNSCFFCRKMICTGGAHTLLVFICGGVGSDNVTFLHLLELSTEQRRHHAFLWHLSVGSWVDRICCENKICNCNKLCFSFGKLFFFDNTTILYVPYVATSWKIQEKNWNSWPAITLRWRTTIDFRGSKPACKTRSTR